MSEYKEGLGPLAFILCLMIAVPLLIIFFSR